MSEGFNPRILGIFCNWCCYAAADSAGVSRYQYPPNVRVIRVMCTGRIDTRFILEAFRLQADGVFIGGCHLGECHYQTGNYEALIMAELTRQVLKDCGVRPDRMALEWASAAEGPRYVELITNYTNKIKGYGELGSLEDEDPKPLIVRHLTAAVKAAENMKVRSAFGNVAKKLHKEWDYSPDRISKEVAEKVMPAFRRQRLIEETKLLVKDKELLTNKELIKELSISDEEFDAIIKALSKLKGISIEEGIIKLAS